ncbi:putative movement protein [Cytorhabdovirus caricae]|uniref:Putative movement protein n=1 Tax=Cytorhabdovirus caricae TaxID=2364291 RepID=A0A386GUF8_9RHAB|nr:putative movement protein [Cytorhabdovirus caricae]AYD37620.2 putative movement protein [Cytorhabdovirus caricae]
MEKSNSAKGPISSLVSAHVSSSKRIKVKVQQHQEEYSIRLPFSTKKLTSEYATVTLLEIFYKGYIFNAQGSTIEVVIRDKRSVSQTEQKRLAVIIPASKSCYLTVKGFSSAPIEEGCPYEVSIKTVVRNIRFGITLGRLDIRPHLFYSNHFEDGDYLTVNKVEGPELSLKRGSLTNKEAPYTVSLIPTE